MVPVVQDNYDDGYIIASSTLSHSVGNLDIWVFKIDSLGSYVWQKAFDGINEDYATSMAYDSLSTLWIAGRTQSYGAGDYDAFVMKLYTSGSLVWFKTYGGPYADQINSIEILGNGAIAGGTTESFGAGGSDAWLLKLDNYGSILWEKTYGGTNNDMIRQVKQSSDGGYIAAGETQSFGSESGNLWLLKLDSNGNIPSCSLINSTSILAQDVSTFGTSTVFNRVGAGNFISTSISPIATTAVLTPFCQADLPGTVPDNDNYPGVTLKISKSGGSLLLNWSEPGGTCVTQDYGIYRGNLPFAAYDYMPLVCSTGTTSATIDSGDGNYYFVVVAQNSGKEGSYGLDSSNSQRPASTSACLPQSIGTCN